jgi:hypothetical protein
MVGVEGYLHLIAHMRHTTVGRTPLDEESARRRDLYLTTHNTHNRQRSMPPAGFEPRNPSKRSAADPRLTTLGHWDRLLSYSNNTNSGHRMSSGGLFEVKSVTVTVFQFIVYRPVSLYIIRDVFRSQRDILEIYSIVS